METRLPAPARGRRHPAEASQGPAGPLPPSPAQGGEAEARGGGEEAGRGGTEEDGDGGGEETAGGGGEEEEGGGGEATADGGGGDEEEGGAETDEGEGGGEIGSYSRREKVSVSLFVICCEMFDRKT